MSEEVQLKGREYTDRALRSFFGARVGGQDRPQDIFTPQCVLDAIDQVWPDGILLDAAPHSKAIVEATAYASDGLELDWPDYTYCNPPYRKLKPWLEKPVRYKEHLLLIPVRPLRVFWCKNVVRSTQVAWLRPVKFVGYNQAYPTPLAMVYYGNRVQEFRKAFDSLATHINRFEME